LRKNKQRLLWRDTFLRVSAEALFIMPVTVLMTQWSLVGPIARSPNWIRESRVGEGVDRSALEGEQLFKILAQEVTHQSKSFEAARRAAGEDPLPGV